MINKLIVSLTISAICLIAIVSTQGSKLKAKSIADDTITATDESCEAIFNETAALVEPVLLIGSEKFPLTVPEIDNHCKIGNNVYKRIRKYGKCLQGLARQALQIYSHGLRRFIRSICTSSKKKQETIDDLKCASENTLKGWNNCLYTVNRQLDFVARNSSSVESVGNVCCVYVSVQKCVGENTFTAPGCTPTTANTTRFFQHSIGLVLKEVVELICSKYSTEEECNANNAEGVALVKAVGQQTGPVEGAFLISPLIKIVANLADNSTDTD